jgi:uncharacterized protein
MTKVRSTSSNRVRDRRGNSPRRAGSGFGMRGGGRGRGGRGPGLPLPMGAGGGLIGVLLIVGVLVVTSLLGSNGTQNIQDDSGAGPVACETEIEQIVCGAVDDVSLYWERQFPESFQGAFPGTDTVFFSDMVETRCGQAPAEVGPFYCPADQLVYFDLTFLEQLQREFGATGDLAAQYIVAHEYGHHVQNVTGISDRMRQAQQASPGAANDLSVALELQADCFAGAWASSVAERGLFDHPDEIEEALMAAEAVGDDRVRERAGQPVDPETFTHGTAEQRRSWFETGFESGDPEQCTTFNGSLAP